MALLFLTCYRARLLRQLVVTIPGWRQRRRIVVNPSRDAAVQVIDSLPDTLADFGEPTCAEEENSNSSEYHDVCPAQVEHRAPSFKFSVPGPVCGAQHSGSL